MKYKYVFIPLLALTVTACDQTDRRGTTTREDTSRTESTYDADRSPNAVDADNTGRNVRDRDDSNPTAFDQSETEADRTITQRIRQEIMKERSLSSNAMNVKIITRNGVVTLRGPVNNANEKTAIVGIARRINGVTNVEDRLEVIRNN